MKLLLLVLVFLCCPVAAQACFCTSDKTEIVRKAVYDKADFIGRIKYYGDTYSLNTENFFSLYMWRHSLQNRTTYFLLNRTGVFKVIESYKGEHPKFIKVQHQFSSSCDRELQKKIKGDEIYEVLLDKGNGNYVLTGYCEYSAVEGHIHEAKNWYKGKN